MLAQEPFLEGGLGVLVELLMFNNTTRHPTFVCPDSTVPRTALTANSRQCRTQQETCISASSDADADTDAALVDCPDHEGQGHIAAVAALVNSYQRSL